MKKRHFIDKTSYNLGSNKLMNVLDTARKIKNLVESRTIQNTITIDRLEADKPYPSLIMNSNLFYNTFKWKPSIKMQESIQNILSDQ